MKKYLIFGLLVVALFAVGAVLAAKPDFQAGQVANPVNGEVKNIVTIPAKAIEVAPNIFYLGAATEKGETVEGYAFVGYRKGFGKSNSVGKAAGSSSCYGFLANGAKWKTIESYIVDPRNVSGIDETVIRNNIALNISKWENAALKNILGNETTGIVDGVDTVVPDNKNEVYFGSIDSPGAIAMTVVWGIFSGPVQARKLVEWDQVYDENDFPWSALGESGKMDFENIATHELGHSVGMNDLYTSACSEQTEYGYAIYGETKKRTLEAGDITGVKTLYK